MVVVCQLPGGIGITVYPWGVERSTFGVPRFLLLLLLALVLVLVLVLVLESSC